MAVVALSCADVRLAIGPERSSKSGYVRRQRRRTGWWLTLPELIDKSVGGYGSAISQGQEREQGPLTPSAERKACAIPERLHKTQYLDLHLGFNHAA
jgi:hypothetical protein